jgi:hypothetical protein
MMDDFEIQFKENMLAYCGLYCEQCSFKLAHDEQNNEHLKYIPYEFIQKDLSEYNCEGCKGYCICGQCKIKDCASAKNIHTCADCNAFPCEYIISFENDGKPHHKNGIKNLKDIRKNGTKIWFNELKPLLKCQCGKKQSWYYACQSHNTK